MTNPTSGADVSDSSGRFPQIFATEGALFDITLKTSAGTTVTTYEDVVALGSGSATFTRDFGNSRARIAGTGGVVSYEGGDPAGDDVGGQVRLGGYSGTQADTAEIDAAATTTTGTLDAGGTITEDGKSLAGVASDVATFTTASSVIIPLTNSPSGIRMWDIDVIDIVSSGGAALRVQFSFDNGATYASAASYIYAYMNHNNTADGFNGATTTYIELTSGLSSTVASWFRIRLLTTNTTGLTSLVSDQTANDAGLRTFLNAVYNVSSARATHMKLFPASGTITGKYRSVPLRGF